MLADGIRQIGDGLLEVAPERLQGLLVPTDINEIYEVEQTPFARGKFAAVRRAIDKQTGVQFAAKFLRRRRRAQCTLREICHEIAVLMLCADSKHIVQLHAVHESRAETALILELATGGELQAILDEDGSLTEHQAQTCMREILKALQYLHAKQIAHLDLKPQNILLCGAKVEDGLKLCDFGISRLVAEVGEVREILGTPDYVAPEVLQYEPLSLATDIWSIGVLAYVLLTGCSPFGGDTKQETFLNISQCTLNFPEDLFEDVSQAAQDFIKSALRIKPKERMTATECLSHHWLRQDPHSQPPPIIRLEHISPKIHPKDVDVDVDALTNVGCCPVVVALLTDEDDDRHHHNEARSQLQLSPNPASPASSSLSLSISPVSCELSTSSSSGSSDEATSTNGSNSLLLLSSTKPNHHHNNNNNNNYSKPDETQAQKPAIATPTTPEASSLTNETTTTTSTTTTTPKATAAAKGDNHHHNKENITCNIKYSATNGHHQHHPKSTAAAAAGTGTGAVLPSVADPSAPLPPSSQPPPPVPTTAAPSALYSAQQQQPLYHHHLYHPHNNSSSNSSSNNSSSSSYHHQHHPLHHHHHHPPPSHFPDAPTTPKVCRKSSPPPPLPLALPPPSGSPPSVKALVKKFQLDEQQPLDHPLQQQQPVAKLSPAAARRRCDPQPLQALLITSQPMAATATATVSVSASAAAAPKTAVATVATVSRSVAAASAQATVSTNSSSATSASTGRKPLGGCDHGIIC